MFTKTILHVAVLLYGLLCSMLVSGEADGRVCFCREWKNKRIRE